MLPGARALLRSSGNSAKATNERLNELFETAACDALRTVMGDSGRLLHWWSRRLAPEFHARVQFPVTVGLTGGVRALRETPPVIVGTIHSVKGGEADVVFLFPDLSRAADAAYQKHGPDRDSVIRLFYVGMTRAKHTLYICQQESASAVII